LLRALAGGGIIPRSSRLFCLRIVNSTGAKIPHWPGESKGLFVPFPPPIALVPRTLPYSWPSTRAECFPRERRGGTSGIAYWPVPDWEWAGGGAAGR
jgi:hypothetical protein